MLELIDNTTLFDPEKNIIIYINNNEIIYKFLKNNEKIFIPIEPGRNKNDLGYIVYLSKIKHKDIIKEDLIIAFKILKTWIKIKE